MYNTSRDKDQLQCLIGRYMNASGFPSELKDASCSVSVIRIIGVVLRMRRSFVSNIQGGVKTQIHTIVRDYECGRESCRFRTQARPQISPSLVISPWFSSP